MRVAGSHRRPSIAAVKGSENRGVLTSGPADASAGGTGEAVEIVRGGTDLRFPLIAAVASGENRTLVADRPAATSIGRESDAKKIVGRAAYLRFPLIAAVV